LKKFAEADFLWAWEKLLSSSEGRFGSPETLLAKTVSANNAIFTFHNLASKGKVATLATFPSRQAMEVQRHFHPCRLAGMYPGPSQKLRFC